MIDDPITEFFDTLSIAIVNNEKYLNDLSKQAKTAYDELLSKDKLCVKKIFFTEYLEIIFIMPDTYDELKRRLNNLLYVISKINQLDFIDAILINCLVYKRPSVIDILCDIFANKNNVLCMYHDNIKNKYKINIKTFKDYLCIHIYHLLCDKNIKYNIKPRILRDVIKKCLNMYAKILTHDEFKQIIDDLPIINNADDIFENNYPIDPNNVQNGCVYDALTSLGKATIVGAIDAVSNLIEPLTFDNNKEELKQLIKAAKCSNNEKLVEHIILTKEILPYV